jgi:raffinose/stachyose/melibiose transport system substrate-binding protein
MKKKLVTIVLASVMAAGTLAGCGSSASAPAAASSAAPAAAASSAAPAAATSAAAAAATSAAGEKPYAGTTLTLWIDTAEYSDAAQALLKKATDELGMEFEVETYPGGTEGDNIIKTRCASGDLPDLSVYNSGSLLTALNPKEHFLDITNEDVTATFDDTFKKTVSQDDKVYGAPFTTTQAGAVIYWKPDYEELGLSVPKTWDEFVKNCDALKKAGKTPVYLSCGDTWTTQVLFLGDNYNVIAADPTFADDFTAGKAKFATTPSALRSWAKYGDLVDMYNDDASAAKYDDGVTAMANGKATHWFMLTQAIPAMIAANPDAADKIGVFGVPGDSADDQGITVWEPSAFYINKDTQNKDAALAFLKFWCSKDSMDEFISSYGANGPSCIKGYTLPDTVCPAIREDMQAYFDAGKTCPALEFMSSIKGSTCEQITTSAALGQIGAEEAAKMYDDDCKKSAVQQGLNWQ